jgi:hypothetical protein
MLTLAELLKKFPLFLEPESSLPLSTQPATGPYSEPHEFSPHTPLIFLKIKKKR